MSSPSSYEVKYKVGSSHRKKRMQLYGGTSSEAEAQIRKQENVGEKELIIFEIKKA